MRDLRTSLSFKSLEGKSIDPHKIEKRTAQLVENRCLRNGLAQARSRCGTLTASESQSFAN